MYRNELEGWGGVWGRGDGGWGRGDLCFMKERPKVKIWNKE